MKLNTLNPTLVWYNIRLWFTTGCWNSFSSLIHVMPVQEDFTVFFSGIWSCSGFMLPWCIPPQFLTIDCEFTSVYKMIPGFNKAILCLKTKQLCLHIWDFNTERNNKPGLVCPAVKQKSCPQWYCHRQTELQTNHCKTIY